MGLDSGHPAVTWRAPESVLRAALNIVAGRSKPGSCSAWRPIPVPFDGTAWRDWLWRRTRCTFHCSGR